MVTMIRADFPVGSLRPIAPDDASRGNANPGGSGFSFADLMADKAGVRFAELATVSEASARTLHDFVLMHGLSDGALLPDIQGLEENIGHDAFRERFDHIESAAYRDMLALINGQLDAMPLYRVAAGQGGAD